MFGSWRARIAYLFGILAVVFVVVAIVRVMVPYREADTIGRNVRSFKELSGRFEGLAKEKGAVYALNVLKTADLPPNTDLHLLGHTVGDVLYKQKGISGIADCTQDFRNACSHSVVIGALNEFGTEDATLKKIDDACKKAPGGLGAYTMCYHGLGHGVFAYFGYDLSKTAGLCKRMGTLEYGDEQNVQCVGGAIMELMGGGGHDRKLWLAARARYLRGDDALSPCLSPVIPDNARSFCLIYLTPELFVRSGANLAAPDPEFFPKAFSYCDVIPKSKQRLRDSCFGGFGKEFVPLAGARDIRAVDDFSDEAYREASSWCALSPALDGAHACVREALQSVFWGGENDPQASFRFCNDTPEFLRSACYDELADAIAQYLPDRKDLCSLLPVPNRKLCGV